MFLVDRDKYSLNDALCDDNGIYKYEGPPINIFFYDNEECTKARQVQEKWCIKQRSGKKYIDREVHDSKIFVLQYYKEYIGDIKRKRISTIPYAASSTRNQINMNDSFLC